MEKVSLEYEANAVNRDRADVKSRFLTLDYFVFGYTAYIALFTLIKEVESGTRLTLRHTLDEPTWAPKAATGWHMCLDVAEYALAGQPIGRIAAADARRFGWEELNAEYAKRFGVENTGWPEDVMGS